MENLSFDNRNNLNFIDYGIKNKSNSNNKPQFLPSHYPFKTNNKKLLESQEYKTVMDVVTELWNSGIIKRSAGYCHSISDMIYKILLSKNIKCKLMECSLTVTTNNPPTLNLIGEERVHPDTQTTNGNLMNTHVVCVTDTPIKMIIDLSVIGFMDVTKVPFICEELIEVENEHNSILGIYKVEFPNSLWIYHEKRNQKIPEIHQESIMDRYKTDKKIFDKISNINKIVAMLILLTSLNFIRGLYDFNQKYLIKSNGFGPNPTQQN